MEQLIVQGGNRLSGELSLKSAKNSVLPIIACCIMSKEDILIKNVPRISDIYNMLDIIKSLGGRADFEGDDIYINCGELNPHHLEESLTCGIRSSIFILGPILSRFKRAEVNYPGGCDIGLRPIDLHIMGLKALNARVTEVNGRITCEGGDLSGGTVNLDFPSVGATENIMMAGVLAKGRTVIRNAAREPEIVDLAGFINKLGGRVSGAGSDTIVVDGVAALKGCEYYPVSDRIVAGTYLAACAVCGGDIVISNVRPYTVYSVLEQLYRCGCKITENGNFIRLVSNAKLKPIRKIETQPFPGFPTDMQAQLTAILTVADGSSMMVENLFEHRFKYTMQLNKMGADITVKDRVAMIKGVKELHPASVKADDLRGGAALVIAAMSAQGRSEISDICHIDRGYYRIEDDLNLLGADIRRVSGA